MKNRMLRVVQLVQRELGTIIHKDLEFPGVIISINSVDVTPDLRHAHIYVGMIGSEDGKAKAFAKLNNRRPHLQKRLGDRIKLQFTPQLHFKPDDSVERGVRITGIMNEIDAQIGPDAWKESPPTQPVEEEDDD